MDPKLMVPRAWRWRIPFAIIMVSGFLIMYNLYENYSESMYLVSFCPQTETDSTRFTIKLPVSKTSQATSNPRPLTRNPSKCKLIRTYDEELRPQARKGYSFLRQPLCEFKNITSNQALEQISPNDCDNFYITFPSEGRLGNQICEYLMAESLQLLFKVGVALKKDLHKNLDEYFTDFEIKGDNRSCASPVTGTNIEDLMRLLRKGMQCPGKHPTENLEKSYTVGAYPCKLDILMDNRKVLSQKIKFKPQIMRKALERLDQVLKTGNFNKEDHTVISLHVRRTDYERRLRNVFDRRFLTPCYYKQAMHHFRLMFNNTVFVVASDDIPWCKENIADTDVVFLEHVRTLPPVVDMATMTLCDHHIVGYGTFSFFGAYLSGTGYIIHHFILDQKITEFEQEYLCSDSEDLIGIPDMGSPPPDPS